MTRGRSLTLLVVSLSIVAACSGSGATASGAGDIPVQDAALVAQGEPLYQASCASCHGADLRGTDEGPSHLSVVYEPNHHGDGAFVLAVVRGVPQHHWPYGDMPPVPDLSEEDVDAIIAYVREQQRLHGFEPYPP